MRLALGSAVAAILWFGAVGEPAAQTPHASATVVASATFSARTSLVVSAQVLEFQILPGAREATAVVDFTAAARTAPGADVVMTVEPAHVVAGPGGAADIETALSFGGEGEGIQAGALSMTSRSVAARWSGGGLRQGRLIFTLRADEPGAYRLPVRFLLTLP